MNDEEKWLGQLVQLNERARAYTAQQWQVPLAYLAIVGVALSELLKGSHLLGAVGFLALGIVGGLVRWHMCFNRDGAARAVCWISKVEERLELELRKANDNEEKTYSAQYREWAHVPLEWMVSAVALVSLGGSLVRLWLWSERMVWWVVLAIVWGLIALVMVIIEGRAPKRAKRKWEEYCDSIVLGNGDGTTNS